MIPLVKVRMPDRLQLMPALEHILYGGIIAEGEKVYEFEREFRSLFGLPKCLSFNSGTAALHASLVHAGVGKGDEVITTSMTAEPTNTSITQLSATPVFADVDPKNGQLTPQSITERITPKTKAVIVVHYAGYVGDIDEIRKLCASKNLVLIEDCAHALGAMFNNRHVGNFGDFGIFSFQAIKHMTTVDGGMACFKNPEFENSIKKFRWFGMEKGIPRTELNISSQGYKYNMNNVTATIGLCQLETIQQDLTCHIQNGQFFDSSLVDIRGIVPASYLPNAAPSFWIYTLLCDSSSDVELALKDIGVSASKLHKMNHTHSFFGQTDADLPGLKRFYEQMIHIPCGWWVTNEKREEIVARLKRG